MTSMKLSKLLYHLYDTPLYSDPEIKNLVLDSREVKPGDLFFAYKGEKADGRQYIDDAIKKGAAAILAEVDSESSSFQSKHDVPILPVDHLSQRIGSIAAEFFNHPSKKLKITGITGTDGKTSCSYFLAQSLQQIGITCGVIGTLGNGLYGNIKPGSLTTPDAISLHALFADFVAEKAKAVAMEVSSHSIEQGRINGIEFEVGIFTNLTRDHLDYHGTMEAYGAAKRKLFDNPLTKNIVINADDPFGKEMLATLKRDNVFAYSVNEEEKLNCPLIYANKIKLSLAGIHANVFTPWGESQIHVPLIGQFNLSNILAVLTSLCLLKVPFDTALGALCQVSSVPGQMHKTAI